MKTLCLLISLLCFSAMTAQRQIKTKKGPVYSTNKACNNFEKSVSGWKFLNLASGSSNPVITSDLTIQSPGYNSNYSMYVQDKSGGTWIFNTQDYNGDYSKELKCFCFDIKLLNNNASLNPYFVLVQGFNPNIPIQWGVNPQIAARFTSSQVLQANNKWLNVCGSIQKCIGNSLPNNSDGSWEVLGNGSCQDFNNLLSNVEGVLFRVDMSGWGGNERFYLDNVCVKRCPDGKEPTDPVEPGKPFDPCCPPLTKNSMAELFTPTFTGGANGYYHILFNPTTDFKNLMQTYTDLIALTCGANGLYFSWQLCDMGNGNIPGAGYCNTQIEKEYFHFVPGGQGVIQNTTYQNTGFFNESNAPCLPNRWYRITAGIYPNDGLECFDAAECSIETIIDFRWQLLNNARNSEPKIEIKGLKSISISRR